MRDQPSLRFAYRTGQSDRSALTNDAQRLPWPDEGENSGPLQTHGKIPRHRPRFDGPHASQGMFVGDPVPWKPQELVLDESRYPLPAGWRSGLEVGSRYAFECP